MMMMKVGLIIVTLLMVSGEISTEEISPALSPIEDSSPPQPETEMSQSPSPSPSPSHTEEIPPSPTISDDYVNPSSSQFPEAIELNHTDITGTKGENTSGGGGKKTVIAVGAIAAASMVGVGVGVYVVLKKRRDNIRRSRYGYAATEMF